MQQPTKAFSSAFHQHSFILPTYLPTHLPTYLPIYLIKTYT